MKLNKLNLGLAAGLTFGLGFFLLGLGATYFDWGTPIVELIGSGYVGYEATFIGAVAGAVWGFVDGLVGGYIFAWFYNMVSSSGSGKKKRK